MPKADAKPKAPKKEKDKDAPKRPLAAYMFFSKVSACRRAGGRRAAASHCVWAPRRGLPAAQLRPGDASSGEHSQRSSLPVAGARNAAR